MEIPVWLIWKIRLCFLTSGYWKQSRNTKWNFAFGITEKAVFDKLDTESRNQDKKEDDLSSVENMLTEAARISREEQGLDVDYMGSLSLSKTVYFETSDFYACTALIPKGSGVLSLVLVYPLDGLKTQTFHQRVWFGGMVLLAVLALVTFSWFFTGKCFALWKRIKGNKPSLLLRHPMN